MITAILSIILIYVCDINGQTTKQLLSPRHPTGIDFDALKNELRHDHGNPPSTEQNNKSPTNVLTLYKWFDKNKISDDQAIFAPGSSAFVQPSQSVKHETNTIRKANKSSPETFQSVNSPETTSKIDPITTGLDLQEINPYYQVQNSPFIGEPLHKERSLPPVQSKSIVEINVGNQIFPTLTANDWKANLERQQFLQEVEKLRSTNNMEQPRKKVKPKPDNSITKILSNFLPPQELMEPRLTGPAHEDKLLMDMLTQGLHPLQEIVVDQPKQRTNIEGIMEEGRGEVPGLHSLQAYSTPDATDNALLSDLSTAFGSNTFQPDRTSFIQSLNRLRNRFTFGKPQADTVSLMDTNTNGDRAISEDSKSGSTDLSMTEVHDQIRRLNLSASASFTAGQLSEMSPPTLTVNGFGLRHGIKNHPNILDFFSDSKPKINRIAEPVTAELNIQAVDKNKSKRSQLQQPRTQRKSDNILRTTATSSQRNAKPLGWNSNIPQPIQIPVPRIQRRLRDNFVVDVIDLPALEVTFRYLPVGSVSKQYVKDINSRFAGARFFNNPGTNIAQTRVVVPWVSNIIVPSLSVNSVTENNIHETYLNTQGRLVDKVTETTTRHNVNISPGQLVSPDQLLRKHSSFSFPLVISKTRSVSKPVSSSKLSRWTRDRLDVNTQPTTKRAIIRQSQTQSIKPEVRKRQRSRSSRFFMPMEIKG